LDEEYAAATPFGGRIAHGVLTAGLISATIANRLPGPGTIYLNQSLNFKAPVKPGETVRATVTIKSMVPEKRRVILETVCRVGDKVVLDGEATVMVTSSAKRAKKA
jgi:3-hydroxybutyryl-CoA dehydratase